MAGRIRTGQLDRLLQIRSATLANDATGQPIETWTTTATVWCKREDMSGAEASDAGERSAETNSEFTIRYRTGVTPKNRLICEAREYDVVSVLEVGRREYLTIMARARAE
jgi:SPP1 family predicted phage head-tail adaptor